MVRLGRDFSGEFQVKPAIRGERMDVAMVLMENRTQITLLSYGRSLEQRGSAVWGTSTAPASSDARVLFFACNSGSASEFGLKLRCNRQTL
jgi:hypothetical protein